MKKKPSPSRDTGRNRKGKGQDKPRDTGPDLFFHGAAASAVLDSSGKILGTNARFGQMTGIEAADPKESRLFSAIAAAEDQEKLAWYFREVRTPDRLVTTGCPFTLIDGQGNRLPALLWAKAVPGTDLVTVAVTENTSRVRIEEMLRATELRYRALVNTIPVGVFRTRLGQPGRILWANPALFRMYGFASLPEFLKKPPGSLYADPAERDRFLDELAREGVVRNFHALHRKKDGTTFPVRISSRPGKNRDGTVEWFDGIVEDLTYESQVLRNGIQHYAVAGEALDQAEGLAICIAGPDGTIRFVNRGLEKMLGWDATDLVGEETPLVFYSGPELAARSLTLTHEAGHTISGFEILTRPALQDSFDEREWTWVCRDSRQVRVSQIITPLRSDTGAVNGYLILAAEISKARELENAFRHSYLQMSGILYNLPDATFAIDTRGEIIAWNRAMEDSTGVKAMDILGKGNYEYALPFYGSRRPLLIDLIAEPDEKMQEWGYGAIRRKGNAVIAETPTINSDNTVRILWCIAAPIFDADGNRLGAIESIADATERRKREAVLEDTVLKFREILNNTGAATAIIGEDGTISYANPEFCRNLGYVREEIEGRKTWMEFVVPEDARRVQDAGERADSGEGPVRLEMRFIRWDGEVRNGYLTITRIPGTRKLVAALFDITEKVTAERAVQEANRKLNFLNSITRHDILNQLTVLKGNLELSQEIVTVPSEKDAITKELAAVDAIQSLISFTRDYQDIGISPPAWQDLHSVIHSACEGIRLGEISLSVEIQGVEIYGDLQLKRVFYDLIQNAIEHGERTTRIRLYCQESFEELHVICEDDGVGVLPGAKELIFSREFLHKDGLDLYLAREILSITGIAIRETGVYGNGAEFEIRVPKGGYRFTAVQP